MIASSSLVLPSKWPAFRRGGGHRPHAVMRVLETREPNPVTVYLPDNSIRRGLFRAGIDIAREIYDSRWLFVQLFKREFVAAYKQSLAGYVWAVIVPLTSIGSFSLLSQSGVLVIGPIDVPYPLFAVLGLATWQLFAATLVAGSSALVKAGPMITKINFSRKTLVLAFCGQAVIPFLVQVGLVATLLVVYGWKTPWAALWAPVAIVPVALLAIGLAMVLALLNGVFRDIGSLVGLVVTFLMLLTPVLYSRPAVGTLAGLTTFNPLHYLVAAPRDLVLVGRISEPVPFALVSVLCVFVFLLSLLAFHLTESRVAERV